MAKDDDSNDSMVTAAAIGGGALALWLLWRGRGRWGLGGGGGATGAPSTTVPGAGSPRSASEPCRVTLREGRKVELNGAAADLATVVSTCRAAGIADVGGVSGALTMGEVMDVVRALNDANVGIRPFGHPDVVSVIRDTLAGRYPR